MKTLTIETIEELDGCCGAQVRDALRHVRMATVLHEDNRELFETMAERLFGVEPEVFATYVWFQAYMREIRESYEDVPSMADVAQQIGITEVELEAYVLGRGQLMSALEGADYLRDLQQDGADILVGD